MVIILVLSFLNMFAFILIDLVWLTWTFIYYFTHPFFIFPSLIIGMFTIATICLVIYTSSTGLLLFKNQN